MGYGKWNPDRYISHSTSLGRSVTSTGNLDSSYSAQDLFVGTQLDPKLNPYNVTRECNDSNEHPATVPVILALDVTGSMGPTAAEVAKRLNEVMTQLYSRVKDVEFMVMGIGDLAYDRAPIQISQFEADIRVAEWLDKIYFERGGGGNAYESYTAAWYMGCRHMMLDSWKRGKKGIIITMGDEGLNPYLPKSELSKVTGDPLQADVETDELYKETIEKFDIYHIAVNDPENCYRFYKDTIQSTFGKYLDSEHLLTSTIDGIIPMIVNIVEYASKNNTVASTSGDGISW